MWVYSIQHRHQQVLGPRHHHRVPAGHDVGEEDIIRFYDGDTIKVMFDNESHVGSVHITDGHNLRCT